MPSLPAYMDATCVEIAGCFASRAWLRLGKSALWLLPDMASLAIFTSLLLLTLIDLDFAGCAYAAYGGTYSISHLS